MPRARRKHVVFLSYSWDSEDHKQWVSRLATRLERHADIAVILDQYDTWAGVDLAKFMEDALRADRIIMVLTEQYARKAVERSGGVGYENSIITGQMFADVSSDRFIPVLRGAEAASFPAYLKTRLYVDMRDDTRFEAGVSELVRSVRRKTARTPQQHTGMPAALALEDFDDWLELSDLRRHPLYIRMSSGKYTAARKFLFENGHFFIAHEREPSNWPLLWSLEHRRLETGVTGVEVGIDSLGPHAFRVSPLPLRLEVSVSPLTALPIIDALTFRESAGDRWRLTRLITDSEVNEKLSGALKAILLGSSTARHLKLMSFVLTTRSTDVVEGTINAHIDAALYLEGGRALTQAVTVVLSKTA
jgi:hypothetical protein